MPPLTPRARALAIVLGALPFLAVMLVSPFGRDQGIYAYTAWAWLQGDMPYRDVYVFKPPATIWMHALALWSFGHSMVSIRVLDVLAGLALALGVGSLTRRWTGSEPAAVLAGVASAFVGAEFDYWNTAQTDGWMILPIVAAMLVAERVRAQEWPRVVLFGAGALVGLAALFKYTALAGALPVLVIAWRGGLRHAVGDAARVGFGVALPFALTAAWLAQHGAIDGFLDSQAGLVPTYVEKTGVARGLLDVPNRVVWSFTASAPRRFLGIGVLAGLVAWVLPGHGAPRRAPAVALLLAGLASLVAQDKYFNYHMLVFVPVAAVGFGVGVERLLRAVGDRRPRWVRPAAGLLTVVLLATSFFPARWVDLVTLAAGPRTLQDQWRRPEYVHNAMSVPDALVVADELRRMTSPDERVFVWGYDPIVNFLAERRTVSRFLYNYPFAVAWTDHRYDAELLGALRAAPPAVFVVGSQDATPHVTRNKADSAALFAAFPALRAFVAGRYGEPRAVERYTVYVRRPDAPPLGE